MCYRYGEHAVVGVMRKSVVSSWKGMLRPIGSQDFVMFVTTCSLFFACSILMLDLYAVFQQLSIILVCHLCADVLKSNSLRV